MARPPTILEEVARIIEQADRAVHLAESLVAEAHRLRLARYAELERKAAAELARKEGSRRQPRQQKISQAKSLTGNAANR